MLAWPCPPRNPDERSETRVPRTDAGCAGTCGTGSPPPQRQTPGLTPGARTQPAASRGLRFRAEAWPPRPRVSTGLQDSVWGGPEASPFRWKRHVHEQRKDRRLLNESPASTAAHENRRLSARAAPQLVTQPVDHRSRALEPWPCAAHQTFSEYRLCHYLV